MLFAKSGYAARFFAGWEAGIDERGGGSLKCAVTTRKSEVKRGLSESE